MSTEKTLMVRALSLPRGFSLVHKASFFGTTSLVMYIWRNHLKTRGNLHADARWNDGVVLAVHCRPSFLGGGLIMRNLILAGGRCSFCDCLSLRLGYRLPPPRCPVSALSTISKPVFFIVCFLSMKGMFLRIGVTGCNFFHTTAEMVIDWKR